MARSNFGGSDSTALAIQAPSANSGVVKSAPNITTGTAWSAATGGTQYTDLILPGGGATTVRTDADGYVRAMQGPDAINQGMWIDLGSGVRFWLRTTDLLTVGGTTTDASLLTSGTLADARLPTASNAATLAATYRVRPQDWVTAYAYVVGEVVVSGTTTYRCNTAHTSAAAIDLAKFTAIGSGVGVTRTDSIWVDDQAGASDDAKFLAALAAAAATNYPPVIRFSNRNYTLSTGGNVPFSGMTIWGPEGYNNPERSGYSIGTRLNLTMTGGWFDNSAAADTYSVSFGNLAFVGGSSASVMTQSGSKTMYCLYMHNISSSGLKSVLGTQASKLLITAAAFDGGAWEINNCYTSAFHLGGSDNTLWTDGCLLDSGTAFLALYSATGQAHLWLDYCEKTYIGPMYITCEGGWSGVKVDGPAYNTGAVTNGGTVSINGAKIEGRNAAAPCYGAVVRVTGGLLTLNDCQISSGMSSPATMGNTPTDAGVIMQTGGRLIVTGGTYDRATGQAETVPFIYNTGAGVSCRVRDISVTTKGGTWTGLPRVDTTNTSSTGVVDDTVTAI